jgi:hypothetical protein
MTRLTSRAKGNEYSPKAYSINIPNKIRVRSDLCIFRLSMTSQKRSRSPMVNHLNDFSRSPGYRIAGSLVRLSALLIT